jgi:spoIIIJ-associated protein
LIGQNGQTLVEIQHLLKAILRRKIPEQFYIDLDINDYKKKKAEYLREMANSLADEVALTKKEKLLAPMPAHERRIIHLELTERNDVVTEGIGESAERRVIIRPAP